MLLDSDRVTMIAKVRRSQRPRSALEKYYSSPSQLGSFPQQLPFHPYPYPAFQTLLSPPPNSRKERTGARKEKKGGNGKWGDLLVRSRRCWRMPRPFPRCAGFRKTCLNRMILSETTTNFPKAMMSPSLTHSQTAVLTAVSILLCRHAIIGVCHNSSYAPYLKNYATDVLTRDRITLLQGGHIHAHIAALGFQRTLRLGTVLVPQHGHTASP